MKCKRTSFDVDAVLYELGKGYEDGFEPYVQIITHGWINSDNLIQIEKDKVVMCPYIANRRGRSFIKEGDYIIIDDDGNKHVCSGELFPKRYELVEK